LSSGTNLTLASNHAVLLTNLTPFTPYYYSLVGTASATRYVSVELLVYHHQLCDTNAVFDFTNSWRYATANLDGVNWAARAYDDSAWDGAGPGHCGLIPGVPTLWASSRSR